METHWTMYLAVAMQDVAVYGWPRNARLRADVLAANVRHSMRLSRRKAA
jgi:hypothetical protein